MVMTGTDAKTDRPVCLKVTGDRSLHQAELAIRRRLSAEFVVELFDTVEDAAGNYTQVLERIGHPLSCLRHHIFFLQGTPTPSLAGARARPYDVPIPLHM